VIRLDQLATCAALLQALPSCGMFSLAASLLSTEERKRATDAAVAATAAAGALRDVLSAATPTGGAASEPASLKASIDAAADVVCKAFK